MISPSDFTNSMIALACWRVAKTELHPAMLGVLMTFQNRAKAEGKEVYEVVTGWLEEFSDVYFGYPDERDPQFQQLLTKMDAILAGLVPDKTGGALWFVPKAQMEKSVIQPFTITATIGQMTFLR